MGRFSNMTIKQAAVEVYGDDLAADFMDHFHRGSVAAAVLGDADAFVCPGNITDDGQKQKILIYLEGIADRQASGGPGF